MRTTKNVSITLPPSMLKQTSAVAKEEGRTQSDLVREALRRYLQEREWQQLRAYGTATAKAQALNPSDVPRLIAEFRAEQRRRSVTRR